MKKIQELLKSQAKEQGPAIALAIGVVLFSVVLADLLYQQKPVLKRGFEIAVSTDGKPVEEKAEKPVDFAEMMKTADVDRGAKIFKKCASCHGVEKGGAAKVGPNLFGIVGKKKAAFAGFAYSDAMKAKGGAWDVESINTFIAKPKDFISGTKMAFPGLKKPQDRADVILFLERQK